MARIRRSKTDNRMFMDIPKIIDKEEEDIKKKSKKVLE